MEGYFCDLCSARGHRSRLVFYQLNFDEAIWLCEVKDCQFPLGSKQLSSQFIVQRKSSEISSSKKKKKQKAAKSEIQLIETPKVAANEKPVAVFCQWQNKDSLCWLHSVLSMVVHNYTLRSFLEQANNKLSQSLPRTLLEKYDLAQEQFITSNGLAARTLKEVRQLIWKYLEPKMKCVLGTDDSPVAALPLLLRESQVIADYCMQEFKWKFSCLKCGYQQVTKAKKILVTFPNICNDFCMPHGAFVRSCYQCNAPGQKTVIEYEKMPDCIFVHFVEGLKSSAFLESTFSGEDGSLYAVTQFVRYSRNPDHFSCWTKEDQGTWWLEMDDLKPAKCCWSPDVPTVPPSEVHIVVWEKVQQENNYLTSVTKVTAEQMILKDISNHDPEKLGAALKKCCRIKDVYRSASMDQDLLIVTGNLASRSLLTCNETALSKGKIVLPSCGTTFTGRDNPSADSLERKATKISNLSKTSPSSNEKEAKVTPVCEIPLSGRGSSSAEFQKQNSTEIGLGLRSKETSLAKEQQVTPVCKTPLSGRSSLSAESEKRKTAKFEPYVPRKQRLVIQSCPSSPFCLELKQELPAEKAGKATPKTRFLSWPLVGENQSSKSVHDDASDSGYSSNASNPGSVNSSEGQPSAELLSPDGHAACCDDTQHERDLAAKLEELLPDSLLDEPSPKFPRLDNLDGTLKTLSAEQDQFLLDLLA